MKYPDEFIEEMGKEYVSINLRNKKNIIYAKGGLIPKESLKEINKEVHKTFYGFLAFSWNKLFA